MDSENIWKRKYERERKSRKEAEKLLEDKSYELYKLNETLKKRIQEEIQKNRERELFLAEQSKLASMGEMIGNIAHQWRQPLSAITTSASGAQLQIELGIQKEKDLEKTFSQIINKANFLSSTIDDFRSFNKSDKEKTNFNLINTVESVKSIVNSMYQSNDIELYEDIPYPNIPCLGYPGKLSQVLLNLLNNARDILVDKKIEEKKVKIDIKTNKDKLTIKVFDNGGGVPISIISKIFEPYFTTKHQSQGTGIGLYMSREIIKNHFFGELYVINDYFKILDKEYFGACFVITFNPNIEENSVKKY